MFLLLESITDELDSTLSYELENGMIVKYPSTSLGKFVLAVYLSMFSRKDRQITHIFEGIVAKDVRRALGMFSDIITSPHVPTAELASASLTSGANEIKEFVLLKALMRGRYQYFNGKSGYIKNILNSDSHFARPTNFLYVEILDYLVRNRKERIDFTQEGYVLVSTLVRRMSQLGFDEQDAFLAVKTLVEWGLVEPESLLIEVIKDSDAVRVHASGFIHLKFLLPKIEYLAGISPDLSLASREVSERCGELWSSRRSYPDLNMRQKSELVRTLCEYFKFEYERRCKRHPFYQELGLGGRAVVAACESASEFLTRAGTARPRDRLL